MGKRRKRSGKATARATQAPHFSETEEQFFREGATLHEREPIEEADAEPPSRLRRLFGWLRLGTA